MAKTPKTKLTLTVTGEVTIDGEVTPKQLKEFTKALQTIEASAIDGDVNDAATERGIPDVSVKKIKVSLA